MMMRNFLRCALCVLALAAGPALPAAGPLPDFELVESVPVETTLDNPDLRNTRAVWLEMIAGARETLDIEQMYVSNREGEGLEAVIAAVEQAAARGVRVRIVAARKFQGIYPETLARLDAHAGIEVRTIQFPDLMGGGIQHAKFFIVDGREAFLGSQNWDWRALEHIHELGLRIAHEDFAQALGDVFELDWRLCKADSPEAARALVEAREYDLPFVAGEGEAAIRFRPAWAPRELSPDPSLWALPQLIGLLDGARERVAIELLNYSPITREEGRYWGELDQALRRAAARGVRVRLIVSDWSKGHPKIDHLKSLECVPGIEVYLSSIPAWSGGFIDFARVTHAKFLVADGRQSWIGCSNWARGYYYASRDVGVVAESAELARLLERIVERDLDSGYLERLDPGAEYTPPKIAN